MVIIENNNEEQILEAVDYIIQKFKESKKDNIVIVNIGTNKLVGDAYGPMLGSMLLDSKTPLKVYGTLDYPITAINANDIIKEILNSNKDSFIIATDAILTNKEYLEGTLTVKNVPVRPARALDKTLEQIGDISILCNLKINSNTTRKDDVIYLLQSIPVTTIYNSARTALNLLNKLGNL